MTTNRLVIPGLPKICRIDEPIQFDDTILEKKKIQIAPDVGNNAANLNSGGQIKFSYNGETKWYSLSDPNTGLRIKVGYITKTGANNDANANVTLSNLWWAHLFSEAQFRLGSTTLETIPHFGVVTETLAHLKGDEFRYRSGEGCGFIPDEGKGDSTYKYTVGAHTVVANPANAAVADIGATANAAATALRTVVNTGFETVINRGLKRRMELYNYPVDNDDTVRTATVFVPLRLIFGSCNVERLLKVINFEITLTRKAVGDYFDSFFGATGTGVQFNGENGTGIQSMSLQLIEYIFNPILVSSLNSHITGKDGKHGKIHWPFRLRGCTKEAGTTSAEVSIKTNKTSHPDYVYVAAKSAQRGTIDKNYSLYSHCNMDSVIVNADNVNYPDVPQNAEFFKNDYSHFYEEFKTVCRNKGNEAALSANDYKNIYTIPAIDCSNHHVKGRNSAVDTSVTIKRTVPDAGTQANPRAVDYFVITESQKSYLVDCIEKVVTENI
jgi:hypothetical protein